MIDLSPRYIYKEFFKNLNTIRKIKQHCEETKRVMSDSTGNNPYAQGRLIEASRVLEILEEE